MLLQATICVVKHPHYVNIVATPDLVAIVVQFPVQQTKYVKVVDASDWFCLLS